MFKTEVTPGVYVKLVDVVSAMQSNTAIVSRLGSLGDLVQNDLFKVEQAHNVFDHAKNVLNLETVRTTRKMAVSDLLDKDPGSNLPNTNFINTFEGVLDKLTYGYKQLLNIIEALMPIELVVTSKSHKSRDSFEDIQKLIFEMQLNQSNLDRKCAALLSIDEINENIYNVANDIGSQLDLYFRTLLHRHTTTGVQVHKDPVSTDIAMVVYQNVDAAGEIESGKEVTEVTAYSKNKAKIVVDTVCATEVRSFISNPKHIDSLIISSIQNMMDIGDELLETFNHQIECVSIAVDPMKRRRSRKLAHSKDVWQVIKMISSINPNTITATERSSFITKEERFSLKFQNETLEKLVGLLFSPNIKTDDIVNFVLARKAELKKFFQQENSFYVCKIGQGNQFTGEAPGALTVIPGARPVASLDEIIGSGFDEVKDFITHIESAAKWHDIFIATSPSKTADKSNVLLIGPQGCLDADSFIQFEVRTKDGKRVNHKGGTIERLYRRFNGKRQKTAGPRWSDDVMYYAPSVNEEGRIVQNEITAVIDSGVKECFEIKVEGGESLIATADHEFRVTKNGKYKALEDLKEGKYVFVHRNVPYTGRLKDNSNRRAYLFVQHHPVAGTKTIGGKYTYKRLATSRAIVEAKMNGLELNEYVNRLNAGTLKGLKFLSRDEHVHHKDGDETNDDPKNLKLKDGKRHNRRHALRDHNNLRYEVVKARILSIKPVGKRHVYDVKMKNPYRNFIANGIAVHNCGKTEVLRAVGSDKNSLGIFAQGSDFMTCWRGEAEKNPKRLFEAGVKLQKESKKHVHFLIDEIDSVLNADRDFGALNLTLEFQILMDGVVQYPNLSVWGTTNKPERIPMPMIRRFSKVLIVGELDQQDRVKLLQHYLGTFLPIAGFTSEAWEDSAKKLEGATGDVIRKIIDHIWREVMTKFVLKHEDEAEIIRSWLNEGEKFQVGAFDRAKREELKTRLGRHFNIGPTQLQKAIDLHLQNIAIHNEIQTAVSTYKKAHAFLTAIKSNEVKDGNYSISLERSKGMAVVEMTPVKDLLVESKPS